MADAGIPGESEVYGSRAIVRPPQRFMASTPSEPSESPLVGTTAMTRVLVDNYRQVGGLSSLAQPEKMV